MHSLIFGTDAEHNAQESATLSKQWDREPFERGFA